jgi:hypothetical protein
MFNDITTLLLRPGVFKDAVDLFVERYRGMGIDAVAGNPRCPHLPSLCLSLPTSASTSLRRQRSGQGGVGTARRCPARVQV